MNDRINKTIAFLKQAFNKCPYFQDKPNEMNYRIEHSFRVANIGKEIAEKENMNVEAMVIGCLLHDVSYCEEFNSDEDWLNHGRRAAFISRPFLESLGYDKELVEEICYGIAIHVDDEADFAGNRTPFALTIGEADNIDRFDTYRIYENLTHNNFRDLLLTEKLEKVVSILEKLGKYKSIAISTKTGKEMWVDKITFQEQFFIKLQKQLNNSDIIN